MLVMTYDFLLTDDLSRARFATIWQAARSDAQDEFRWFLSQDGKGVLVQARYAGVWVPAAEVSVS